MPTYEPLISIPFADENTDGVLSKEKYIQFDNNTNTGTTNYAPKVYNVKEYGAVGNDVADDTAAFQAAVQACLDGNGGDVYIPNGSYFVNGALQHDIGGIDMNSQIYIPYQAANSVGTKKTHIRIIGETRPVYTQSNNPYQTAGQLSTTGVIIRSGLTTYSPRAAIIGTGAPVPQQGNTWQFNYVYLSVENITFKVVHDVSGAGPVIGGVSYKFGASLQVRNCLYMTDIQTNLQVRPTNDIAAFETGDQYCETMNVIENCWATRIKIAFSVGENITFNQMQGFDCEYWAEFKQCNRAIVGVRGGSYWNRNEILISGACHFYIDCLDGELLTDNNVWEKHQYSIVDTGNLGKGYLNYNFSNATSGGSGNNLFNKNGGKFITANPSDFNFYSVGNPQMNAAILGTDTRARMRTQGMVYVENTTDDSVSNAGFYAVVAGSTTFPFLSARRSQGTIGAFSATLANDVLLRVGGGGYSGSAWASTNNAQIDFIATGNHTASSQPTGILFYTTPANSIANTERMRIDGAGAVNIGTSSNIGSAILNISSTTRGVILPKMTTVQRDAILSPVEGLEIYNLDVHAKQYWNGTVWKTCLTD